MKERYTDTNGYILVYSPGHPKAIKSGAYKDYVYEHQLVAEEFLERELRDNETIHHLDTKKDNNHPSNLLVLERSQHAKLHHWMNRNFIIPKPNILHPKEIQCPQCNKLMRSELTFCSISCAKLASRKVDRPDLDQLGKDIINLSMVKVGEKYGVADNTIRQWAASLGLPFKLSDIR